MTDSRRWSAHKELHDRTWRRRVWVSEERLGGTSGSLLTLQFFSRHASLVWDSLYLHHHLLSTASHPLQMCWHFFMPCMSNQLTHVRKSCKTWMADRKYLDNFKPLHATIICNHLHTILQPTINQSSSIFKRSNYLNISHICSLVYFMFIFLNSVYLLSLTSIEKNKSDNKKMFHSFSDFGWNLLCPILNWMSVLSLL